MGEYAIYNGQRVKIGTCEDMLYLRWDQAHKVTPEPDSLDPVATRNAIRFRFPWPEEDGVDPGNFDDPDRGFRLDGFTVPAEVKHGTTQFTATYPRNGYLVSLPCPEGPTSHMLQEAGTYKIGRNGYGGSASLIQQAWRDGRLVGIAKCNGCGSLFRLEDGYEDAAAVAIRSAADQIIRTGRPDCAEGDAQSAARLHEIADRLLAGYALTDSVAVPA